MTEIYRTYLFDGSRWDMDGLAAYYTDDAGLLALMDSISRRSASSPAVRP